MTAEPDAPLHEDELIERFEPRSRVDDIAESISLLLSHHPPSQYGHCLRVTFRGHSMYFCGRCSGIYGGLGLGIIILFAFNISLESDWLWFLISLAIGFATVVDWVSQRLTPRKTTNFVRAITGFISGFSLAIIFFLGNLLYMLIALIVMGVTVGGVGIVENRRTSRLRAMLEAEEDVL
ncbi:MAG: DUF2085 domain-containing protein [Candidatus Thorarchaeota archaeon]